MNMTAIRNFIKELELQLRILFHRGGWGELKLYRSERNAGGLIVWAPSKGRWVRARILRFGQRNLTIRFVDGEKKKEKRSTWSVRPRDPRKRGKDVPWVDARYSGNPEKEFWTSRISDAYWGFYRATHSGITIDEMRSALKTLTGG